MPPTKKKPKHQQVSEKLRRAIVTGEYKPGEKLPSEAVLVKRFNTSRITVGRALRDLQRSGLVERRAGSGTYARSAPEEGGLLFGLLIPDLGQTEIFEPICRGISRLPTGGRHALLWGNASGEGDIGKEDQAWRLCRQYVEKPVSGVFFAPLELTPRKDQVNQRVLDAFEEAGIPVVLLDRYAHAYPLRSGHDLVGIDNRRAGYLATEHLLKLGCRRIGFVAHPDSASTVEARVAGYREALLGHGGIIEEPLVGRLDPACKASVRSLIEGARPEAFVCANDRTAGALMHSLLALGHPIPGDFRIVGIDDVEYANLLPVPLTTIHQPCLEIGEVAMATMIERVARPRLPAREILLDVELVVRQSCGALITGGRKKDQKVRLGPSPGRPA